MERDGGGEASHWPVGDKPRAISATAAGHLLVTCSVRRQLRVFSDAGLLLRAVDLPDDVACPCAALQLPAVAASSPSHSQHDRYLVFHASLTDNAYQLSVRTHRVCNSRKPPGIYKKLSYRRVTRDASCQLKSCQLPRNSAETTCTTSPEQIEVMKFEGYIGAMCNKHFHSTMTRSSRFHCLIGVINKPTTDRVVDITCIPTTCCGEIF